MAIPYGEKYQFLVILIIRQMRVIALKIKILFNSVECALQKVGTGFDIGYVYRKPGG